MILTLILAKIVSVALLIMGVSRWFFPQNWTELMLATKKQPYGAFGLGLVMLPLALVLVIGHGIWVWHAIVLITILGWLMLIISILFIFVPDSAFKVWPSTKKGLNKANRVAGIIKTSLGVLLIYYTYFSTVPYYLPWSLQGVPW